VTAAESLRALRDDDPRVQRVAGIIYASLQGRSIDHLRAAVGELREAEAGEGCAFCRSHITDLRILGEDLVGIAELGERVGTGQLGSLSRRIGALAERTGALAVLGRLLHRMKGFES
jgi:hypothetical protein